MPKKIVMKLKGGMMVVPTTLAVGSGLRLAGQRGKGCKKKKAGAPRKVGKKKCCCKKKKYIPHYK